MNVCRSAEEPARQQQPRDRLSAITCQCFRLVFGARWRTQHRRRLASALDLGRPSSARNHGSTPNATRIDATIAGSVGTINGFAICVLHNRAKAGGGHQRPRPPGVMRETAESTQLRYCIVTVKTRASTLLAAASCWAFPAMTSSPTSIVTPAMLTVSASTPSDLRTVRMAAS